MMRKEVGGRVGEQCEEGERIDVRMIMVRHREAEVGRRRR
jgi:hypothetical protein